MADIEALELNVEAVDNGGEKCAIGVCDERGVMVITDSPLDLLPPSTPTSASLLFPVLKGEVDDHPAAEISDIRRASAVGE